MMSKEINRILLLLMGLTLTVAALASGTSSIASAPQAAGASAATTRSAAIMATTVAVLKETSQIRELAILRPVRSGAQTRADIERMVVKNLDEQTTPAEMHATDVALKKLGLAPKDFQYRPFIIKLLTEQVAGYYDTKVQQFYLADWIDLEGQKPVMAHELTHALQDQHFDLKRFEKWPKGDSDAELAAHALIEGDATLAMTLYMAKNPLVALAFVRSLEGTNTSSEQFKQAPRALRESLVFPYEKGSVWATTLFKRGGWAAVSGAFSKLPQSTEQILHPEKYLEYEAPVKVTLPELGKLLGPNWRKLDNDVNGEWGYFLVLDEFLQTPNDSKRFAAGWAGDRYLIYEGPKPGDVLMVQLTVWDTEADAQEFKDAYSKRTVGRYPGAKLIEAQTPGNGAEPQVWETAEGLVLLELRGKRVLIVEGVTDEVNSKALMKLLWE